MTVGGAAFTANRLSVQFISVPSLVTTCLKIFLFINVDGEMQVTEKDSQLPISLSFGTFGPAAANLAQQGRSPDQVTT